MSLSIRHLPPTAPLTPKTRKSPMSPSSTTSTRSPTSPTSPFSPQSPQSAGESFEDLLGQLDATSAFGRRQDAIRATTGPRIPYVCDLEKNEWRPLPKLDAVRDTLKAGGSIKFVKYVKNSGSAFSEPAYLKPKVLNVWVQERVVQPNRSFAKTDLKNPRTLYRFKAQSESLPPPSDDLLDQEHAMWLVKQQKTRWGEMYPVPAALDRVARAQKVFEVHEARRCITRDLLGRLPADGNAPGGPQLGENAKKGLAKALSVAKSNRNLMMLQGINNQKDEEDEDRKRLYKAKSAPVLQHGIDKVPGRLEHLRAFKYTDVKTKTLSAHELFRTSTCEGRVPWQHEDEISELKDFRKTAPPGSEVFKRR